MKRLILAVLTAAVLGATIVPASAHEDQGVRCRFAHRGPVGRTFRVRIINRTRFSGFIECGMVTWGGSDGRRFWTYDAVWVPRRSSRYDRFESPRGDWDWIDFRHAHGPFVDY